MPFAVAGQPSAAHGNESLRRADAAFRAGFAARQAGNLDLALSVNGRYLYQLRGSGPITALRVESDGHLTTLGVVGNMPGSVAGLAAR